VVAVHDGFADDERLDGGLHPDGRAARVIARIIIALDLPFAFLLAPKGAVRL
jgi:hypothetical protein